MNVPGLPPKQGLYDPRFEKDGCGIGFVVNIKGKKSHQIVNRRSRPCRTWTIAVRAVARKRRAMGPAS